MTSGKRNALVTHRSRAIANPRKTQCRAFFYILISILEGILMAHLNAKTEYAVLAAVELAKAYGTDAPSVSIRTIAERDGLPPRFLVQILLQLKGAGLVRSIRGAAGGYLLTADPAKTTVAEIINVIDGEMLTLPGTATGDGASPERKKLQRLTADAERARKKVYNGMTLAQLAGKKTKK